MPPFQTVLLDPPWPEKGGGKIKRGADRHYPTVTVKGMHPLISTASVWDPADDAHMYMWVTNNYLVHGLQLMEVLGFRYVTNIVWVKIRDPKQGRPLGLVLEMVTRGQLHGAMRALVQYGLGQYFRGGHEILLFGVRGHGIGLRTERRDLGTVVFAERDEHSAKPQSVYELVEARSPGPFVEMFARTSRSGWTSWGNEAPTENGEVDASSPG